MTEYGSSPVQYFAEAWTGGGSSITIHAVSNVLTTPTRTATPLSVPSYAFPDDVPQFGGAAPADAIDARIMTGVWRDGSMWFSAMRSRTRPSATARRWSAGTKWPPMTSPVGLPQ